MTIVLRRTVFVTSHLLRTPTDTSRRRVDRHLIYGQKNKWTVTGLSHHRPVSKVATNCRRTRRQPCSSNRPFDLPISWSDGSCTTFFRECSRRRLVDFDNGPIDGEQRPINVAVRMETDTSFFEDHVPCAVELPKSMPCMDGTSFFVLFWNVSPGSTGFESPQNTVDHSCVVRAFFARVRC